MNLEPTKNIYSIFKEPHPLVLHVPESSHLCDTVMT